ncbi:MAG: hypothetical protein ACTHOH_18960, partial [Lysobacteraceae bacterium]
MIFDAHVEDSIHHGDCAVVRLASRSNVNRNLFDGARHRNRPADETASVGTSLTAPMATHRFVAGAEHTFRRRSRSRQPSGFFASRVCLIYGRVARSHTTPEREK